MRIGICDGSSAFLLQMEQCLNFFMEEKGIPCRIFCFSCINALTEYFKEEILDLIFLNVEGRTEIEAAKELLRIQPTCEIIYCSDSLKYATAVYETKHCYYLLKEKVQETLPKAVAKAMENLCESRGRISVYSGGGNEIIPAGELMYAERSGKKTYLHLCSGEQVETPERIEVVAQKLIWPRFVRCHNSFIISFDRMRTYTRHQLIMDDGREIPVSRPYLAKVRKAFGEWNRKNL